MTARGDGNNRSGSRAPGGLKDAIEKQLVAAGLVRPRLVDVHGAGRYCSISPWTIRELHWAGKLSAVRLGRRLLFDLRDLDALIEQNKVREPAR